MLIIAPSALAGLLIALNSRKPRNRLRIINGALRSTAESPPRKCLYLWSVVTDMGIISNLKCSAVCFLCFLMPNLSKTSQALAGFSTAIDNVLVALKGNMRQWRIAVLYNDRSNLSFLRPPFDVMAARRAQTGTKIYGNQMFTVCLQTEIMQLRTIRGNVSLHVMFDINIRSRYLHSGKYHKIRVFQSVEMYWAYRKGGLFT